MQNPFEEHPRIFVVDDEIEIAKMMCVVLQMNVFDAVPFADPQEALEAARDKPPDYLLTDIMMRGMSGIDLAVTVQKEMPACKVMLFSGQVDAVKMIEDAGEARFPILQKPVHPTDLVAAIKSL